MVFGAETGFQLESDPDTVRAPDAAFVTAERIAAIGIPSQFWPGPPDVAFEVSSPGDRRGEVESTTRSWLAAGAAAVVVIDPRRRVATVHRADGSSRACGGTDTLDLDDVIAGFAPAVDELFATCQNAYDIDGCAALHRPRRRYNGPAERPTPAQVGISIHPGWPSGHDDFVAMNVSA